MCPWPGTAAARRHGHVVVEDCSSTAEVAAPQGTAWWKCEILSENEVLLNQEENMHEIEFLDQVAARKTLPVQIAPCPA